MIDQTVAPRNPVPGPPPRLPRSVRRTSTIYMTWPDGILDGLHLHGRCRDLLTDAAGEPATLRENELWARVALDRTIESISSKPDIPGIDLLVGERGGGRLRQALEETIPGQRAGGTPLYLLLDDVAGASLIAGFVWSRWRDHLPDLEQLPNRIPVRSMEGICMGHRPGSSALNADGTLSRIPHNVSAVPPLWDQTDPVGWHDLDEVSGVVMRRARRIDVWAEGDTLRIDAMFRDSCWEPDGSEIAVHEYALLAESETGTETLSFVMPEPRVLPYDECPAAAPNVERLLGVPLAGLRDEVLARLSGVDCCTHLNDALRALAEVPVLAADLRDQASSAGSSGTLGNSS